MNALEPSARTQRPTVAAVRTSAAHPDRSIPVSTVVPRCLSAVLFSSVLCAALARADTPQILSVTGSVAGQEGLIAQSLPAEQDAWKFLAVSWSFTEPFAYVSAKVYGHNLYALGGTTFTYSLVDGIGPSATQNNVIWSGSHTFDSAGYADGPIFQGLSLNPDTYYLVIAASGPGVDGGGGVLGWWSPTSGDDQAISARPHVQFNGTLTPVYRSANAAFPPASAWGMWGTGKPTGTGVGPWGNLPFVLADHPLAVPEVASSLLLFGIALVPLIGGSFLVHSRCKTR